MPPVEPPHWETDRGGHFKFIVIGQNMTGENGLQITCLMGRCAIEMSNGEIGLKRFLTFDQISLLVSELEAAKVVINQLAIQEDTTTERIEEVKENNANG